MHMFSGSLNVVRTQPRCPVPYTGSIEIRSGEIAEDLTQYMAESEQTNTAMALGVKIDTQTGKVVAAGGFYVRVRNLPLTCMDNGSLNQCLGIIMST
jgi:molecular chaperone Hsp33